VSKGSKRYTGIIHINKIALRWCQLPNKAFILWMRKNW
jgi:hypothetical protein